MGIVSAITAVFGAIVGGLGAIGITGTAASIIAGVVTAGIAIGTAKQLGTYLKPDLSGMGDPGVRIQLPPGTDNKIPVVYGDVYTSGPIIDVNISNQNNTMHYCIVLSEETTTGNFSIGEIYWNDAKLVFGTGANAHKVVSKIDKNASTNTDWNGKIRVRAYAGGTTAAKQIFPVAGGGVTAVNATTMMPHWTTPSAYTMSDLVFVMVEVDYSGEDQLTGLGALSIELQNSLNNPGDVLLDYLTNSRYGCGLQSADIDTDSITGSGATSMKSISNELVPFTRAGGGSATRKRYTIDGVLSTFDVVKTNIDKICVASSAYFMFDGKQGKFKVKMNHTEDTSSAFVLDDDNIVSSIKLQNTSLFDMYNQIQVEFADHQRKDQSNTVFIETAASNRMANEPDNKLEYRVDMVNNNIQAKALANIDLSQTRNNQILQFNGDHSTLQIDVGDVVKVTNDTYGLSNKEYRVMRIKETEDETSVLTTELTMIQYNSNIYGNVSVNQTPPNDAANANVVIPPIIPPPIIPPGILGNFFFGVEQTGTTGSGSGAKFTVRANAASKYDAVYVIPTIQGSGYAVSETLTVTGDKLRGRTPENDLTFQIASVNASGAINSVTNSIQNITGNAVVYGSDGYGSTIDRFGIAPFGAGGQVDTAPAANTNLTSNTAVFREITAKVPIDLANIENGKYTVLTNATPLGELPGSGAADYGIRFGIDVEFANNNTITNHVSNGQTYQNFRHIPSVINSQGEFEVTEDMISAEIKLEGFTTLANVGGAPNTVGFTNLKYDMLRINKGEIE